MVGLRVEQVSDEALRIIGPGIRHGVRFTGRGLTPCGETQVLSALAVAMPTGLDVEVDLPVAPGFLAHIAQAQQVLCDWFNDLNPVRITASEELMPRSGHVALYSGGVDSSYTLVERRDAIDRLILVHGYDLDLDATELRARVSTAAGASAATFDKDLVQIESTLRPEVGHYMRWGPRHHGLALAAAAYLLAPASVTIPSSYWTGVLFPWGTHPGLDQHFGSDLTTFDHHGSDVTRPQKVMRISTEPAVLRHLRICYLNTDGAYNCGRCGKCLGTMITLAAVGKLDECATLPSELDLTAVRNLDLRDHSRWVFAVENYRALKGSKQLRGLRRALRAALVRARFRPSRRTLRRVPGVRFIASHARRYQRGR